MLELLESTRARLPRSMPSALPATSDPARRTDPVASDAKAKADLAAPLIAVFTSADPAPLKAAIEAEGMRSLFCDPAQGDLAQVLAQRPAIVVAEIHHGGFGGFDLIRMLRSRGFTGPLFALLDGGDTFNGVVAVGSPGTELEFAL